MKTLSGLKTLVRLSLTLIFITILLGVPLVAIQAQTIITVNSLTDIEADDGECTLREALTNANSNLALFGSVGECEAGSGLDTITLAGLSGNINLTSALPEINADVVIQGNTSTSLTIQRSPSAQPFSILKVTNVHVSINGLTLRDGSAVVGGGIYNQAGLLTLVNVYLINNTASSSGGGIFNDGGKLDIIDSMISNNTATSSGGGIFSSNQSGLASVTLTNSMISNNTATSSGAGLYIDGGESFLNNVTLNNNHAGSSGAGLFNDAGVVTIRNVTISGNDAASAGGGIYNISGTIRANNVTIATNSAPNGSGVVTASGIFNFSNTLIATNTNADCIGSLNSFGYNLIQTPAANCVIVGDTTGNIIGQSALIDGLTFNNIALLTHALQAGSPAVDAGNPVTPGDFTANPNACEVTDQRGIARPIGLACDIGAFESPFSSPQQVPVVLPVIEISPANGESDVSVKRETIIRFRDPITPTDVTSNTIYATFSGNKLNAHIHISPDNKTVTLFYSQSLPANSRVRLNIDGNNLHNQSGQLVDVNQDGVPGGVLFSDFDTLNLTTALRTSVCGRVFASELAPDASGRTIDTPLRGVTISVDGREADMNTRTSMTGDFCLNSPPLGSFFVHIDGRTVVNDIPDGSYYPYVGKVWESKPGEQTSIGTIYLPLITANTLQTVSASQETQIGFSPTVLAQHPEFADVTITVPADSLYSDDGIRGGKVGIAPVSPDRLPVHLPPELKFPIVITVQTDGPSNFDVPVPICFPNMPDRDTGLPLAPNSKSALFSYNHDKGEFEIVGPMTVTADGKLVCSDPGFGVRAPGWHGTQPGTSGSGGGGAPPDTKNPAPTKNYPEDPLNNDPPKDPPCVPGNSLSSCAPEIFNMVGGYIDCGIAAAKTLGELAGLLPPLFIESIGGALAGTLGGLAALKSSVETVENVTGDKYKELGVDAADKVTDAAEMTYTNRAIGGYKALKTSYELNEACNDKIDEKRDALEKCEAKLKCPETSGFAPNLQGQFSNVSLVTQTITIPHNLYDEQTAFFDAESAYFDALMGSDVWDNVTAADDLILLDTFNKKLKEVESPDSIGGRTITSDERNTLLQIPLPSSITSADVEALVVHMNQMSTGTLSPADVALINTSSKNLLNTINELQARGWDSEIDFFTKGDTKIGKNLNTGSIKRPMSYRLTNVTTGFQLRGNLTNQGVFNNVFLSPNALYKVEYLDPDTLDFGTAIFASKGSGVATEIPIVLVANSGSHDADNDGLSDEAEQIAGTDLNNPDSDGDGVKDGAEIQQGLDPLDGKPVRTGVIATADTPGTALDFCLYNNLAAVADGDAGVSLFNLTDGLNPLNLGQVATPGSAIAVACDLNRVIVADGNQGLSIIDTTDPMQPKIIQQFNVGQNVQVVTAGGNIAYAGTASGRLLVIDLRDNAALVDVGFTGPIQDLTLAGDNLYVLTNSTLYIYDPLEKGLNQLGSIAVAGGPSPLEIGRKLFVGDNHAYVGYFTGYSVIDVSNPSSPVLVGQPPVTQTAIHHITANGSGLVIATTSFSGPESLAVSLYDGSDPTDVTRFLTSFDTPGLSRAVTIHNGLAFVADSAAGIQVINYLPFDTQNIAPTITLSTNVTGTEVIEGSVIRLTASVNDDVQVRNVEFLVNGVQVATDGSFPFEYRFRAPAQGSFTVSARAVDTGGNQTLTSEIALNSISDTVPPTVTIIDPANGEIATAAQVLVRVNATDNVGIDKLSFTLDGQPVNATRTSLNSYSLTNLSLGNHVVSVTATDVNGLSTQSLPVTFNVIDFRIGDQITARLDFPGDIDAYSFTATSGNEIILDAQDGSSFDFDWQLTAPDGSILLSRRNFADQQVVLPLTGTYTLTIDGGGSLGAYTFQIFLVPPPPPPIAINIGDAVNGNLEVPGAVDIYTFTANANDAVILDSQSGVSVTASLKDPNGNIIFQNSLGDSQTVLPLAGVYTLTFDGAAIDTRGAYTFQTFLVPPPPPPITINIGDVINGNLEVPGAVDIYTFTANANDAIILDNQFNSTVTTELKDPNGNIIFQNRSGDSQTVLPLAGVYTLTFDGISITTTGTYTIPTFLVPPPPAPVAINIGDVVSGNLEVPGAVDVYTFTASANTAIIVDTQSGISVTTTLKDPNGNIILQGGFGDSQTVLPLTGVYTLTIDGILITTKGAYTFQTFLVPPPNQTAITIGQVVSGNLEVPGAVDVYTFTGNANQKVVFDPQTTGPFVWSLKSPTGATVFQGFSFEDQQITLPANGTYTLTIDGSQITSTGTYQFQIIDVLTESFAISIGSQVSNGVPQAGAGNIELPGHIDIYTFLATAGQRVYFDEQVASNSLVDWRLNDPNGNTVFNDTFFSNSDPGVITLPVSGTYSLTVSAEPTSTATYQFQLWSVPQPQTFTITIGTQVSNGSPAVGAGNLETPAASDVYRFNGVAGQRVYFDDQTDSNVGNILWQVTRPNTTMLFSNRGLNTSDPGMFTLPDTGVYTITVTSNPLGNTNQGAYQFKLVNPPPIDTFAINLDQTVSNGSPGLGAGNIEVIGSQDTYTFTGTAGQRIYVDSIAVSGNLLWEIIDPAGIALFSRIPFSTTDPSLYTLSRAGVYTINVFNGSASNNVGTYSFIISSDHPPVNDDFADAISISTPSFTDISDNSFATRASDDPIPCVSSANNTIWYQFVGSGNPVRVTTEGSSFDTVLTVWTGTRGNLTRVACDDDSGLGTASLLNFSTNSGVTYFIMVSSYSASGRGTYQLNFAELPRDEFVIAIGDQVSNGVPRVGAGNIELAGAQDVYTFEAAAGQRVYFNAQNSTNSLQWRLDDPLGSTIFNESFNNNAPIVLSLPGTYTLVVSGVSNTVAGTYQFQIFDVTPQQFTISIGDIVDSTSESGAGNIETLGARDIYTFEGTTGQVLFVDALEDNTSNGLRLQLLAPDSTLITDTNFFNRGPFTLTQTGTYTLIIDGYNVSVGTYSFDVVAEIAPTNDDINNALPINSLPLSTIQSTRLATTAVDDPQGSCDADTDHSVWYSLIVTANQTLHFEIHNTVSGDFDPILSIYTGTRGSLTEIACKQYNQTFINVPVSAGTTYFIKITDFNNLGARYTFTVSNAGFLSNDNFENAATITSLPYTASQSNVIASLQIGEQAASCSFGQSNTLWYRYTAPSNQTLRLDNSGNTSISVAAWVGSAINNLTEVACSQGFNPLLDLPVVAGQTYYIQIAALFGQPGQVSLRVDIAPPPPTNDNFSNAVAITGLPFTATIPSATVASATFEANEPNPCASTNANHTVWYKYTATSAGSVRFDNFNTSYNSSIGVWTGTTLNNLVSVVCKEGFSSFIDVNVSLGETYYLQVGSQFSSTGNFNLVVDITPPPPANDNFTSATSITQLPFSQTVNLGTLTSATLETSEVTPSCASSNFEHSMWYRYTATTNQTLEIDGYGTVFPSVVAVWTGTALTNLTQVSCTIASNPLIDVPMVIGTTYWVQIGGQGGSRGTVLISLDYPPPFANNNNFSDATIVGDLPFNDRIKTTNATTETGEPSPNCGSTVGLTVWYRFTATNNATITFTTDGAHFDTVMSIWTGTDLSNLTQVGCDDDSGEGVRSTISLAVTNGQTYYINIGGYRGASGLLAFKIEQP